jgi:hypothetical protein
MIFKQSSVYVKALMFFANPTSLLPRLFPLTVEHARVGDNTTDFVRVSFK